MEELSKGLKRECRKLADLGYERCLDAELTKVEADFSAWKAETIDAFELTNRIHAFQNGPVRKLRSRFEYGGDPKLNVSSLVIQEILKEDELSPELRAALAGLIDWMRARGPEEAVSEK